MSDEQTRDNAPSDSTQQKKPAGDAPPPVRRSMRKPITLVACGVILGVLILVVLLNLERSNQPQQTEQPDDDVTEIVEPGRLTDADLEGSAGDEMTARELGAVSGGWIQIADTETGRLSQQYRFESLDPAPEGTGPGWFTMGRPELEVYLSDGRVILLRGDQALAHAPERAVESGTITGNVGILLFEDLAGPTLDAGIDEPSLVLYTDEAEFNNILGEIRCEGRIDLQTRTSEFEGRRLKLLINDQQDMIELLRVEEVDFIRLAGEPVEDETERPAAPPSRADRAPSRDRTEDEQTTTPSESAPSETTDPEQFYRLTLTDNVRVDQGRGEAQRTATGDELSIIFTFRSEGLGPVLALNPALDEACVHDEFANVPLPAAPVRRFDELLTASVFANLQDAHRHIAPPPDETDTIIHCDGGLTMKPLTDPAARLDSPEDALLELVGEPVRLTDRAAQTNTVCGVLQYRAPAGRIELIGTEAHAFRIESPELIATSDGLWVEQAAQRGRFIGAGVARFLEAAEGPAPPPEPAERLHITWDDGVDLAFEPGDRATMLGGLRSAIFQRDVVVQSEDLALTGPADGAEPGAASSGELRCDELTVNFDDDGEQQILRQMIATGEVVIADDRQTIWTALLDVTFRATAAETSDDARRERRDLDVETIIARNGVQMLLEDGQRIFAETLNATPRREGDRWTVAAELSGDDVRLVDAESVIDRAQRVIIDERTQRYEIDGRGRLRRFDRPVIAAASGPAEARLFDHLPDHTEELRIEWTDGVETHPVGATGVPSTDPDLPRLARFAGDVRVTSPEMKLSHADEMLVRFASPEDDDGRIESIDASGGVRARSVGRPGEIRCEQLHVDVTSTERGGNVPERAVAIGQVHVADEHQRMWAESMTVTFRPLEENEAPGADDDAFSSARVAVDEVSAKGEVQVLLRGGERVFADRFVAHPKREDDQWTGSAEIFGERVMVIADDYRLDRGRHLALDEQTGEYQVLGPGEFASFAESLGLPATRERIAMPVIADDLTRTIDASWTESAFFTEGTDGTAELELAGDVEATSRPSPRELNTAEAQELTLRFIETTPSEDGSPEMVFAGLRARGEAQLESRMDHPELSDVEPRVFYIAAPDIDFDQQTYRAVVVGAGELLISDQWPDAEDTSPAAEANRGSRTGVRDFAGKGDTLFRWQERLDLKRTVDEIFHIAMDGDVRCIHSDPEGARTSLQGAHLEADVVRPEAPEADRDAAGAIDFGGPMEIRRISASGGLLVRTYRPNSATPVRDVACDEFEYDVATGIARVAAAPGRMISIITEGVDRPLRAERVHWDMTRDRITVVQGAASGSP